ncbi:hypothetical protein AYL99_01199 [Fonsecaea erecta]|uniref:Zn(2)-C6 fungal-type domain-containing protein n=1 Tax=Fonsecaea erecta TaxID=1367422 RepID=A0A178ZZP7_9EURO|nr:hypothetical protein AYL99_01199 [Fonsecaea erecta]OAP65227.1 hypothetical protein AYL99_01199 [Fonsecaea erecta]
MDLAQSPAPSRKATVKRVSLACVACRGAHVKCNGKRPCERCSLEGTECLYAPSRRGGLNRAALVARRNLVVAVPSTTFAPTENASASSGGDPRKTRDYLPTEEWNGQHLDDTLGSHVASPAKDPLIHLYYRHFHKFHPLAVPLAHLERLLIAGTTKLDFHPLLALMRYIGSLYSRSVNSNELKAIAADAILEQLSQTPPSPVMAQCYLLQSISLHWCDERERAQDSMDTAIRIALRLSMNQADFALTHGEGDPVIEESWRRTWWQIYIIDAHYAAIRHAMTFPTSDVDTTMELPCEEEQYESGIIPTPRTLAEFDAREFASDDLVFSSFAYLIGAVRGIASAISRFLTSVANTSDSSSILEAVDAAIDGWLLLLPESKRIAVFASGETDEHMFQAHMAIHAATVGFHRPLSELPYDSLEYSSCCSAAPPEVSPSLEQSFRGIHTTRCLRSTDCLVQLLSISSKPAYHTPFTVCMVSSVVLAHLSACRLLFQGQKLAVARDQIRMCIGCLRPFAGVWPLASRSLCEVQTVAREVLGLNHPHQRHRLVDSELATVGMHQHSMLATETLDSFTDYLNLDDGQEHYQFCGTASVRRVRINSVSLVGVLNQNAEASYRLLTDIERRILACRECRDPLLYPGNHKDTQTGAPEALQYPKDNSAPEKPNQTSSDAIQALPHPGLSGTRDPTNAMSGLPTPASTSKSTISVLLLGATGSLGSRILGALLERPCVDVTVVVRNRDKLNSILSLRENLYQQTPEPDAVSSPQRQLSIIEGNAADSNLLARVMRENSTRVLVNAAGHAPMFSRRGSRSVPGEDSEALNSDNEVARIVRASVDAVEAVAKPAEACAADKRVRGWFIGGMLLLDFPEAHDGSAKHRTAEKDPRALDNYLPLYLHHRPLECILRSSKHLDWTLVCPAKMIPRPRRSHPPSPSLAIASDDAWCGTEHKDPQTRSSPATLLASADVPPKWTVWPSLRMLPWGIGPLLEIIANSARYTVTFEDVAEFIVDGIVCEYELQRREKQVVPNKHHVDHDQPAALEQAVGPNGEREAAEDTCPNGVWINKKIGLVASGNP